MPKNEVYTDLHLAARDNDLKAGKRLIAEGADVNANGPEGNKPLHFAASEYALDVARLLIESGADIDSVDNIGNTS